MAKKNDTAKRANYKALLEWRIANNLPDEWLIAVGGNMANEVYSLDQVRQMHVNSPTSIIQVLNSAQRQNPNAEWVVFREVDKAAKNAEKSAKETAGCAYTAAIFIPIVGLLIGLFMIANDKTRSRAFGPIVFSIIMMVVWWVVIIATNS
jgi:hypothetical protein